MKSIYLAVVLLFTVASFGYDVRVHVVDDQGASVAGARAAITFVMFRIGTDIEKVGTTNEHGVFQATGRGEHSVSVEVSNAGYYSSSFRRLAKDHDLDLSVVIPRVLNPLPLFAWDGRMGRSVRAPSFPVQNVWLGYDFEVGDWIKPHGKGKVADIQFKFRNSFRGYEDSIKNLDEEIAFSKRAYAARNEKWTEEKFKLRGGKWDAELEISFPAEKEGIFEEKRFLSYSQLKLPHSAPLDGYVPTWRYTANSYSPRTARENVGFFLRTRVKLDQNGRVIAANYAKVMGDFYLVPQGSLMFCYYFNPVPNDRNLEFDPKRNLFPPNLPGANVGDP